MKEAFSVRGMVVFSIRKERMITILLIWNLDGVAQTGRHMLIGWNSMKTAIRPVDLTWEGVGALRKIKQEKKLKTNTVYAGRINCICL